ncbi:Gfo/Idh/MocA family oxidoreductase [Phyllobacterium sp. YR531]|uniref:Gfo/Idh/MocA family protein n=1 Tax=Phyllobacterium sp. YR531 TaxID=1144343 RepID=UPI00026FA0EF|nr:Gfo/Idh/MocA family oxidoreductase [Phyllobacterium sp. YR531]EJN06012.1 putative dehydrogenase [Phyllobacterium sp. YR531]
MDKKQNPVRWGILGAARIATAKTIPGMISSSWCVPYAVGARDLSRAQNLADQFQIPRPYGSYEDVISDPAVEAIYIALPNHLHVEWALKAAKAGKHVLCEKPIALTASEAVELRSVPPQIKISEAFMVRQQPRWEKLRDILRSGQYGAPKTAQMLLSFFMNNPDDFRNRPEFGGGANYDLGCYTAMTARFVFEQEPLRVVAVSELDRHGVDTFLSAILDFGGGRHASFTVSTAMASAQTLHIVCERGFIDVPKPYVPAREEASHIDIDVSPSHDMSDVSTTSFQPIDQYAQEVENFSRAIRGQTAPFFGIDDAIANMKVMDALFASAKTNAWVEVAR